MQIAAITIVRHGAALMALMFGTAVFGQAVNYPPGAVVQSLERGPGDDLARHLSELSAAPRSISALLGAGNAALKLGDTQGALSFFARAEEVAPRDGRVKAGMAAAFVQSEDPRAAFRFFGEAQALGIPVQDFAKDRGLAYDMIGDPVRAQADYALALSRGSDAEVERRMALSRAISGDKPGALAILEPQLRRQDRAGWRTRAFVLALTGDAAGAASVAQSMLPGNQSSAMRPFFDRLPQLSAADKAMAVHFGHFPQGGRSFAVASAAVPAPVQSAPAPRQYGPSYRGVARTPSPTPTPAPTAPSTPTVTQPQPPAPRPATPIASNLPVPQQRSAAPSSVQPAASRGSSGPAAGRAQSVRTTGLAPSTLAPASVPEQKPTPASPPVAKSEAPIRLQFADVVTAIESLPDVVTQAQPTPAAPRPAAPKPAASKPAAAKTVTAAKTTADKKPDAKASAKKAEPAKPKEPARIWVQLAAAQDKKAFASEYKKIQAKAPKLLAGKTAWTAPLGNTNRLLVGPFKTDKEARDLVNELAKLKLGSYSWKSSDGQVVEKVPAK